jgi:tRNA(Ile)-lysidine synthase
MRHRILGASNEQAGESEARLAAILDNLHFESSPVIAIALSGGSDSMALLALTQHWTSLRNAKIIALTVDHRLRPESAAEAAWVHEQLAQAGIEHHILRWDADKPSANLQSEARNARYALMEAWCRERHILHLLVAHHRDDQAETLLVRLERGSGIDGLSAMPWVSYYRSIRLIRPLLSFTKQELQAYLTLRGKRWCEDPSNGNLYYTRNRIRRSLSIEDELLSKRLAATATHMGRARVSIERHVAKLLVASVALHPQGYALLAVERFKTFPEEEALRALAAVLMTIGCGEYTPRFAALSTLYRKIIAGLTSAVTLAGCSIIPQRQSSLLLCREVAAMAPALTLVPGMEQQWDERFTCKIRKGCVLPASVTIGALGSEGWRKVVAVEPSFSRIILPKQVIITLPALKTLDSILTIPHIGYYTEGITENEFSCRFQPRSALTSAPFAYGT